MSDDQDGCECVSVSSRVVPDQRPLNGCVCVCVLVLFGVLAVVVIFCHLNHIRLLTK